MSILCYKLVRIRKDGTLGSLFINKKAILPINKWIKAKLFPTNGYAERLGFHCVYLPFAPHLKQNGRVWVQCEVDNCKFYERPKSQGGLWILANKMKIIKILSEKEIQETNTENF